MESKTKELVKAGHELVVLLGTQHGMHDAASLVQRLTAQLDITAIVLREKSKQCEALAAENAAQREYRPQLSGAAMMEALDAFYEYHEDVPEQGMMAAFEVLCCKRPQALATDAFLREQMAKGVEWNEGNTPDQFGRYWVRYETDVGPQYCSAQWMEYNFCAGRNNIHNIWLADHSRSINSLKGVTHYARLPRPLESSQLRAGEAA